MAWVDPVTVATGDLITAAQWNQDVVNNADWLANTHWRARMERTVAQTIANNTVTTVNWTAIPYDFGSLASTVNDDLTIPVFPVGKTTALVEFVFSTHWDDNATGSRRAFIFNKTTGAVVVGDERNAERNSRGQATVRHEVVAGDVFEAAVQQDSGASLGLQTETYLFVRWLAWQD